MATNATLTFKGLTETVSLLDGLTAGGPREVAAGLNDLLFMWHAEAVRHIPVDKGLYRASLRVDPAVPTADRKLVGQIGTSIKSADGFPYPAALEFGWGGIAGGKVAAWTWGKSPIMDWPAKRGEASSRTQVKLDKNGRARGVGGKFVKGGSEEYMPPLRGSWQSIMPKVRERLVKRMDRLIKSQGRK